MPPLAAVTPQEFLKVLWGGSEGWAELTAIGKDKAVRSSAWEMPNSSLDSFFQAATNHNQKGANVYMGITLRREKWPRNTGIIDPLSGKPKMELRGTEDNAKLSWVVWAEFDFAELGHKGKTVPEAVCRKTLKDFARAPSIILRSGGGIQVYWLLKEAAEGAELWKLKAINKSIAKHFGADTASVDLARILRIPGLVNHKYNPPRPCEISWWKPESRYTLDDFDFLPQEDASSLGPKSAPAAQQGSSSPSASTSATPGGTEESGPRRAPNTTLDGVVIGELSRLFSDIWLEGHRHAMALQVAGLLAFHGIHIDSAKAIVLGASNAVQGDSGKRLKDVEDTYRRFILGEDVVGGPTLDKMISDDFPVPMRKHAAAVMVKIRRILPRPTNGSGGEEQTEKNVDADFDIIKVIKYDSRPARYTVVIRKHKDTEDVNVPCDIDSFSEFKKFRKEFTHATHNKNLAPIKQLKWEHLYENTPCEIRPAPKEATIEGAILNVLEEFLEQKKENPQYGELKTFAGYNDKEIFFSLRAYKVRLRDYGIRASDHVVTDVLKGEGWKDDRRWVGDKNPRLWFKILNGQGGGTNGGGTNGNGHPPPPKPPPVQPELFTGDAFDSQEPQGTSIPDDIGAPEGDGSTTEGTETSPFVGTEGEGDRDT